MLRSRLFFLPTTGRRRSAIDRLDSDSLLIIFQLCVHAEPKCIWSLEQVSKRWKRLARSSGALWSTISLSYTQDEFLRRSPTPVQLARRWLDRSGDSAPLDVTLHLANVSLMQADTLQRLKDVLLILLPYSHRWRSFSYEFIKESLIGVSADLGLGAEALGELRAVMGETPLLERLSISDTQGLRSMNTARELFTIVTQPPAPRLRTLLLRGVRPTDGGPGKTSWDLQRLDCVKTAGPEDAPGC
ncbi:hypothetical protein CALCODRAFT_513386 [Calocera cornea HHB12733]|uniref:F-box domain-containing protein n=1 Tax=Calocera cornea HHB12733 TaxID=1353952 RepID=A0A165C5U1_9BASI|nr:hypothetical protein CALCODRAFT_513386 [Calocera cornea HHB12733]